MESIVKRGKSFSVVYYVDGKPKWESCETETQAKERKIEIEYQQSKGTFVPPSIMTVSDLLDNFIESYGKSKWGFSAYDSNVGLLNNYVIPEIGYLPIKNCTTKRMTTFFDSLRKRDAVQLPGRKSSPSLVSDRNIYDIYNLLNIAFRLAVEWEELGKNPLTRSMKPTATRGTRDSWDGVTALKALTACEVTRLLVCMHLAVACSMRNGEVCGLRWSNVTLNPENDFKDAELNVDVQLSRISRKAYEELKRKENQIKFIFPEVYKDKGYKSLLVLKTPKTLSSVRKVYIPRTTAKLLYMWKNMQKELKTDKSFQDFDLVVSLDNGRPIEGRVIMKMLSSFT